MIFRSIYPNIFSNTLFFSLLIITFVFWSINPCFYTKSILLIIFPFTFKFCTIYMNINPISISFIINPISFEIISIDMPKFSLTICSIILPFTLIFCTIWPYLNSFSISNTIYPISLILGTTFKSKSLKPIFILFTFSHNFLLLFKLIKIILIIKILFWRQVFLLFISIRWGDHI